MQYHRHSSSTPLLIVIN